MISQQHLAPFVEFLWFQSLNGPKTWNEQHHLLTMNILQKLVAPSTPVLRNNNSENPKRTGLKNQTTQKN